MPEPELPLLPNTEWQVCYRHEDGDLTELFYNPALSTARFYLDTLLLPYQMVLQPPWGWECTSGAPAAGAPEAKRRPDAGTGKGPAPAPTPA